MNGLKLEKLTTVGKHEPQSAYAAFVKSLQFHCIFFQKVFNDTENSFQKLYETIKTKFISVLFDNHISDEGAILFT